jgi:hypothetical protein
MMPTEANTLLGLAFVLLATVCNGTFALPPKFVRNWAWENTWGLFFLLTLLVLPGVVVFTAVSGVAATWRQADPLALAVTVAFGFLWGCGIIGFGIGVTRVGLSLGFAIIIGLSALLGSLVPLIAKLRQEPLTLGALVVILGVLICVGGIAACGRAGVLRERTASAQGGGPTRGSGRLLAGLAICVAAGICSSGSNIGFDYGQAIKDLSQDQFGNPPWLATLAVWMLVFCGGFVASGAYATCLLVKNSTWRNFANRDAGRNFLLAAAMAVLHFATLFSYGVAAHYLGKLGTSVGYASFMSCSLLVANAMGFMTHEWKDAGRPARQWVYVGLALLVLGIAVLTLGNSLRPPTPA